MSRPSFSLATRIKLAGGLTMPQIHLGVYLMTGKQAAQAVRWSLEAGYRGIDSAQMYHNERDCGKAIREYLASSESKSAGVTRDDIFFASKLADNGSYTATRKSIKKSLQECGLDRIDIFLLHSPYGGKQARLDSWRAVEDAVAEGEIRIGGVSNFGIRHLQELMDAKPRTLPAINQIEVHPFNTRRELCDFCQKHDIVVEAYGPLVRGLRMTHPMIVSLAEKYKCTPAQLMLRWSLQHGYVPLPKSSHQPRILENAEIGGFHIDEKDMATMDGLDEYLLTDWDPVDAP